jgi:hypothetical protein
MDRFAHTELRFLKVAVLKICYKLDGFLLAQPIADLATTALAAHLVLPGMMKLNWQSKADGPVTGAARH